MAAAPAHLIADLSVDLWETTLGGLLSGAAAEEPDRIALVSAADGRRWMYAELDEIAHRVARALSVMFDVGDRIAIWSTGLPEFVLLQFGAARAGLVIVPLNPAYQTPELRYALLQSGARAVFVGPPVRGRSLRDVVESVRSDVQTVEHVIDLAQLEAFAAAADTTTTLPDVVPGDPVMIQYTSGTTGTPKGALLTHRGIGNNARFSARRAGVAPGGVWLNPLPMFHTGGCVFNTLGAVANRGVHVLMPSWDAGSALELIERERVTFLCCVPTMVIAMLEHEDFEKRDCSTLQTVLCGGSTISPELVHRIEAGLHARYVMVFGQSESGPTVTMTNPTDPDELKACTIGYPLPHTEVKVADPETGQTVERSVSGELCVRGYGCMTGYYDMPQETAATIDTDGWVHTGDLARMTDDGYLTIAGRLKEIIRRGGMTVSPRTVEDLLFGRPGVGEICVVGVPDERLGERVAAFVRPAPDAILDVESLQAFAEEHLAHYKVPEYWVVVDAFPTTPSGKIQRFVLRDRFLAGDYTAVTGNRRTQ
jgi:fatty-acyl-CoA synthase